MTEFTLDEGDAEHVQRLQELRELGTHNMFTECQEGLTQHFGEDGQQTYEWVVDNFELFRSGKWKDVEVEELPAKIQA